MVSIRENLQKIKDPQRVNRNIVLRVEKLLPMPDRIALQKTLYVIDVKGRGIFNLSVSMSDIPEESENAFLGTIHSINS